MTNDLAVGDSSPSAEEVERCEGPSPPRGVAGGDRGRAMTRDNDQPSPPNVGEIGILYGSLGIHTPTRSPMGFWRFLGPNPTFVHLGRRAPVPARRDLI